MIPQRDKIQATILESSPGQQRISIPAWPTQCEPHIIASILALDDDEVQKLDQILEQQIATLEHIECDIKDVSIRGELEKDERGTIHKETFCFKLENALHRIQGSITVLRAYQQMARARIQDHVDQQLKLHEELAEIEKEIK